MYSYGVSFTGVQEFELELVFGVDLVRKEELNLMLVKGLVN